MNRYESLEAELHDAFWNEEECSELPVLERFFAAYPGRALEVGSGSGRLLLPLLRNGIPLEGLEPSAEMLALCRQEAEAQQLAPSLHEGTLDSFQDKEGFDAIAVPAFTIQLTENPAEALKQLATLLKTDGGLYITTFQPFAELDRDLPENEWYPDHELTLPDSTIARVETRHTLDRGQRILHREHRYSILDANGAVTREHSCAQTIRYTPLPAWKKAIRNAGLTLLDVFADFDPSEEADCKSQIITVIAKK